MNHRTERVLAWLQDPGPGEFTCRQIAFELGITSDQALVAVLALHRAGTIEVSQDIGDVGARRFRLRRARPQAEET